MAEQFDLASAAALLQLQADGVILTRGRQIAFMNRSAVELMNGDFTGAQTAKVLPAFLINLQSRCCAAAVTMGERLLTLTVSSVGIYRLYTLRAPQTFPAGGPVSQELWTDLMNLRLLSQQLREQMERLESAEGQTLTAMLTRVYHQIHRKLTNEATLTGLADGTMPFLPQPVNCADALRRIEDPLRKLTEEQGIELRTELPEELAAAMADSELLNRALLNLLLNSLASCKAGDFVRLSLKVLSDHILLTIHDSGSGIPAEKIGELLWSKKRGGFAVVQGVMGLHGGSFLIESDSGSGATVRLLLPKLKDAAALHSDPPEAERDVNPILLSGLADFLTPEQAARLEQTSEFV